MDVKNNFTSFVDREENEPLSFGGSETQKITRSNNPPIRKLRYFGHVMRAKGSVEQNVMLGKVAGYRRQGKPRIRWLDSIREATGLRLGVLKEAVQDSCRDLFQQLQILTLPPQYIYSLLVFFVKNRDLFLLNLQIYNLNTRYKHDLHLPSTNLTLVQRGVLYSGSKFYNCLPLHIKNLSGDLRSFKRKLKNFLADRTFYSLDEYYYLTSLDNSLQ